MITEIKETLKLYTKKSQQKTENSQTKPTDKWS